MRSRSRILRRTATTSPIAASDTECIVGVGVIVAVAAIARTGPISVAEIRKAPRSIQDRMTAVTVSLTDRRLFVAIS